tara:strand:- start:328 stop:735 length:408 start_codon:yes stop_codon:yes gene_type:complete
MKKIILVFIFIIINFSSLASNIKNEFEKIRNNDLKNSKVFETKNFYFSQIIFKWEKGSSRKLLSRQGMLDSINQFKSFFISTSKYFNKKEIDVSNKSKLKFKNSRKIEDRRFKDKYIVVFAFPKKELILNKKNIN